MIFFQHLEKRCLLASLSWVGSGDGSSWTDPQNWSSNTVPTQNDDVTIAAAASTQAIQLQTSGSVRNLITAEPLEVVGTELDVFGDLTLQNTSLTLGGASVNNNPTGRILFTGSQSGHLNGTGMVELNGANSGLFVNNFYAPQRTLTIASGIDIRMTAGGQGWLRVTDLSQGGYIINHGSISASSPGGLFTVGGYGNSPNTGDDFVNDGSINVTSGASLNLGGRWSSATPLNVADGDLILGGYLSASTVNRVVRTGAGNTRVQGSVDVSSVAMHLDATTGSMIMEGGSINGPGNVTTADGTQLTLTNTILSNVTLAGNFLVKPFTTHTRGAIAMTSGTLTGAGGVIAPSTGYTLDLHVSNGVRLSNASIQGTVSVVDNDASLWIDSGLASAGIRLIAPGAKVIADGSQTWTSGSLSFENSGQRLWIRATGATAAVLTLNSGFLIKGGGGTVQDHPDNAQAASFITKGTLRADASGGSIVINLPGGTTATGTLQANAASTLRFNGPLTQTAGSIVINGGVIALAAGGSSSLHVGTLTIVNPGRLDLADNDLALDYTGATPLGSWNGSIYTGISGLLQSGRNGGNWDGSGIITSQSNATGGNTLTTLGVAEASDVLGISGSQTALWNGQTVDATNVIVKYTYAGDANLDGVVNGDDYFQVDSSFPQRSHGWSSGDFNYDGVINGDDYFLIDSAFPQQGVSL